jgi:N-acetylneuraminic acid mutarotase
LGFSLAISSLRVSVPCVATILLTACGGGGSSGGSPPSVTTYNVSATAGTGGSISPSSATVNAAGTTTFTVTPKSGYVLGSVTGCGGTLAGSTYTTGAINANCTVTASFAAAFTWVSGSNTLNAQGVYGTQGVAAATNMPGARDGGITWTDASGNLWMYGGFGGFQNPPTPSGNFFSDLWKYSPSSGEWTWVSGSSALNTAGVYGTQGVAAAANTPGARSNEVRWTDAGGNLWLFGGGGYGYDSTQTFVFGLMSDLWKYSPSSNEWTWVGGSSTVNAATVYGTQGVAAAGNDPGARDAAVSWTDASGTVWLFGGAQPLTNNPRSDLWKYSPSSNEWTWIGGSNTTNASGVYGTQGVAAPGNLPGARYAGVNWADANGNLWLFGGYGYDAAGNGPGYLNDLWKYSPSSGEWTWVGGSNTLNAKGVYGTQGTAAAANGPGARAARSSTWTDASGNLWLFGSNGYDSAGNLGYLNDLWRFSPSNDEWTWISGSSTVGAAGVYGTQGAAAAPNVPGARGEPIGWTDAGGNLWLFGGFLQPGSATTRVEMNDLWKYPTQ